MPPRIPALQRLGTANLCRGPATKSVTPNFLPIIQTANLSQRENDRKAQQDPYRWAQAQQRRNANLKRREELQKERNAGWGDPVWGKSSEFVESFATVGQPGAEAPTIGKVNDRDKSSVQVLRNHFVTDAELGDAIEHAFTLSKPMVGLVASQLDPSAEAERAEQHKLKHQKAVEALKRITSLENSSARDRYHVNVQRIIDELGRHKTDKFLKPKPRSIHASKERKPMRAGPDTGSSEVQIGILTAKITALGKALQMNRGYKDKHNKRNLRLLLHRRQKLLKYMEKKERGSERWTNMLEKLGLTPATWKEQIDL